MGLSQAGELRQQQELRQQRGVRQENPWPNPCPDHGSLLWPWENPSGSLEPLGGAEWFHWAPSPVRVCTCSLALLFWWVGKSGGVFPSVAAAHDENEKWVFLWMEQVGSINIFESHRKAPCPEMVSTAGHGAEPSLSTLCPLPLPSPCPWGAVSCPPS